MDKKQFLALIDDLLELDRGAIKGNEELNNIGWNSLSVLGFMALADEHFGLAISPAGVSHCKTVDDLVDLLGNKVSAPQTT